MQASATPATATQRILSEIWQDVLQAPSIGLDDNFFEIGGDSFLALQVYALIKERYAREFPMFDLSLPPTIRSLAAVIDAELAGAEEPEYRSLKKIRGGEEGRVPLFLVHGGDGNARVFQRLAKNLDPRIPLYAFRWPGWDGQRGDSNLRDMATTYKAEMIRFRPAGPYRIGGYCVGGLVALELARLLQEEGRQMDGPLYIWDSPNMESKSFRPKEPRYAADDGQAFLRMVGRLNELRWQTQAGCPDLPLPAALSGPREWLRRLPGLYSAARDANVWCKSLPIKYRLLSRQPVPIKRRWYYCMSTCYFALRRHAARKYAGPVVFFRSDVVLGRTMNMHGWWDDPFLGFGDLCEGSFRGHAVGGDHVDVLGKPKGGEIVNRLYFEET